MANRRLMRDIAKMIEAVPPGKWVDVEFATLEKIGAQKLLGPFGPTWQPEEWIMENIIGSSWNVVMVKDHSTGNVTFKKLEYESSTPTYISPDRR